MLRSTHQLFSSFVERSNNFYDYDPLKVVHQCMQNLIPTQEGLNGRGLF